MYKIMMKCDDPVLVHQYMKEVRTDNTTKTYVIGISYEINLTSKKKYRNNLMAGEDTSLLPPQNILATLVNDLDEDRYTEELNRFYRHPNRLASIIEKILLLDSDEYRNIGVILYCSDFDAGFGYLDKICKIIKDDYGCKVVKLEKFLDKFDTKYKDFKSISSKNLKSLRDTEYISILKKSEEYRMYGLSKKEREYLGE